MSEKNYDHQNSATMRREERHYENQKAKAEALEENCKKTLANLMKQETAKKVVARDMKNATGDQGRLDEIRSKVQGGEGCYFRDEEVITGLSWDDEIIPGTNMEQPWER